MAIYFIIIIIEFILYILLNSTYSRQKSQNIWLLCVFVILWVLAAFRSTKVGGDLEVYLPEFHDISGMSFRDAFKYELRKEKGFLLFEKIISIFSTSDHFYLFCVSSLIYIIYYKAIKQHSCNYYLSGMLFTCIMFPASLNILRATISVGLGLHMYPYIKKRNFKMFIFLLVVATLIQRTSIIMLPMYFLYDIKYRPKLLLLLIFFSMVLSISFSGSQVVTIIQRYIMYDDHDMSHWSEQTAGLTNMAYVLFFLTIGLMLIYKTQKKKGMRKDSEFELIITFLSVAVCFQLFSSVFMLMTRLGLFYYSYLIILAPYIISRIRIIKPLYVVKYTLVFIFLLIYISGIIKNGQAISPYSFSISIL